jgi:hypothetical protein
MSAKREPLYEGNPYVVLADGLAAVIPLGSVTHLLFTAREAQLSEGGKVVRNGQVRLIVPTDCLQEIALTILRGERIPRSYDDSVTELVIN